MSNDTPTGPAGKDDGDQVPDDTSGERDGVQPDATAPDGTAPEGSQDGQQSDATPTERFGLDDAAEPTPVDDAPTERFDTGAAAAAPADAPTDRFDAPAPNGADPSDAATKILPVGAGVTPNPYVPPAAQPRPSAQPAAAARPAPSVPPAGPTPPKNNRTLLYWLIGIGAVLLVAVIALLVWLFAGDGAGDAQPTATPTPSATPAETPTPIPTPEPTQTPTPTPEPTETPVTPTFATFSAPTSANCEEGDDDAPLSFSWSSSDAVRAYLGVGTQNAAINPTVSDLPPTATYTDLDYDCSVASQVYTVTLEDELGSLASRSVTITK